MQRLFDNFVTHIIAERQAEARFAARQKRGNPAHGRKLLGAIRERLPSAPRPGKRPKLRVDPDFPATYFETMNGNTATVGYRYITNQPGVRGSHAIIEDTRVGVHDVVSLLQNGETVDSVVTRCFPNVTRAQVYECLAYYEDHRGEIDVLVARQMSAPTP